jgi:two-component system chemotaxis response regulator CheY
MDNPAILYVEDDWQSRMVMQILLEEEVGLSHVYLFEDSQDFLARAEALQPRPDLILLDIHVRPDDGFTMLAKLRASAIYQHTPVVALTASVMNEEVARLREAGFTSVIAKPIDQETFPAYLSRILSGEPIWHI